MDEIIESAGAMWWSGVPWLDAVAVAAGSAMAVWVDADGDVIDVTEIEVGREAE